MYVLCTPHRIPPFTLSMPFRLSRMMLSTMLCSHHKPPAVSSLRCRMPRRPASLSTWGREAMPLYPKLFSGRQASTSKRVYGANSRIHELFFATLTARPIQAATDKMLRFHAEMVSGSVLKVLAQLHVSEIFGGVTCKLSDIYRWFSCNFLNGGCHFV